MEESGVSVCLWMGEKMKVNRKAGKDGERVRGKWSYVGLYK